MYKIKKNCKVEEFKEIYINHILLKIYISHMKTQNC